ncbi:MAG: hypothetical protein ABI616_11730 [Pseudomonadota bacterium]
MVSKVIHKMQISFAIFLGVLLLVGGFVWALLSDDITVTYMAIAFLSLAGTVWLLISSMVHSNDTRTPNSRH